MPDIQRSYDAGKSKPGSKGRIPIYRTKALYHNYDKPWFFPLAKAYETSEWRVTPVPPGDAPARPDEAPQPDEEDVQIVEEDDANAERSVAFEEGDVDFPQGDDDAPAHSPRPEDLHPELDFPMIFHGTTWFKGPFEILPDGTWVRRRAFGDGSSYVLGRCPGFSKREWKKYKTFKEKDDKWAEYIANYGLPPRIPDAAETEDHRFRMSKVIAEANRERRRQGLPPCDPSQQAAPETPRGAGPPEDTVSCIVRETDQEMKRHITLL
ncbi:MAG: hypothetical protein VX955_05350, partial [Pseudomonadota bacterium]|nr:hypothetical protein [Pseudomonadota bacterium]